MEINYRNLKGSNTYSYSYEFSSGSDTYETTTSVISISFGASILLWTLKRKSKIVGSKICF
jgi:hypothetical protein